MDTFKRKLALDLGIILGGIILATIGLYVLSGRISTQVKKIIADRSLVAQQTAALASLADLTRDAPQAAKYEAAINKLLPDQYQLIGFSDWLAAQGQQFNVTTHFNLQSPPSASSPTSAGTAPFTADAEGSVANIVAFLKDIETQAPGYLLSVNSFDLSNNGDSSRVNIQGTLYVQ